MKKPLLTAFFLVLVLLVQSCSKPSEPETSLSNKGSLVDSKAINWVSTSLFYDSAATKKPLSIIYFTDDVCSDGFLMEYNTFLDSAVIVSLNSTYNIARVSTANDSLVQFQNSMISGNEFFKTYNLVGVPSLLILDENNVYFGRIQADYYQSDSFLVLLQFYKNRYNN